MILKEFFDVSVSVRRYFLASFSSLAFRIGLTLRFSCALRAIIAGLITSCGNTHCIQKSVVTGRGSDGYAVILGYALCFSLGACFGFVAAGICANASDKKVTF